MKARRKDPPKQPPPVQRLRLQYAKRGRARFGSHRDFSRALERALRRANIPMAYSSGFTPHPRISYAGAAPTSAASEAEFFELALAEVCDPEKLGEALSEALPEGLDIIQVAEATSTSLSDLLTGSLWLIQFQKVSEADLAEAVEMFVQAETIEVERTTKSGVRTFDVRGAVEEILADGKEITVLIRHLTPLVRPDDVVSALGKLKPGIADEKSVLLTRLNQGTLVGDQIINPLVVSQ